MTDATYTPPAALPRLHIDTLVVMLLSGAIATVAFDLWGQVVAPLLGLGNLAPVGLAQGFLGKLGLGELGRPGGHAMHLFLVGLIGYPVGWLFVFRPIWARIVGNTGWFLPAALYGAALWVFAIGGIAGWVTGNAFLGFTKITWVALAGHVIYGVVLVAAITWLDRRRA